MRYSIINIETTTVKKETYVNADNHRLISFAALNKTNEDKFNKDDIKQVYVSPIRQYKSGDNNYTVQNGKKVTTIEVPKYITDINGISNDMLKTGYSFLNYYNSLTKYLDNSEYLVSFNNHKFNYHVLNNEETIINFITSGNNTNFSNYKYIDLKKIYDIFEKNDEITLEYLISNYFKKDEAEILKNVDLSDQIDALIEKQIEVYPIENLNEYFKLAFQNNKEVKLAHIPISIYYSFNSSKLENVYLYYTGKVAEQEKITKDYAYKMQVYDEILNAQLKKYKLTVEELYQVCVEDMFDYDGKILHNIIEDTYILNFGKHKGEDIRNIEIENPSYLNYMLGKNKDGNYNLKIDTIKRIKKLLKIK